MQYFENNNNLKSELRVLNYKYKEYNYMFYSDLGVFSKDKIDAGSKLLLETYLKENNSKKSVLDVGCGVGFLGVCINKVTDSNVDMIDINKRAIHLTKMNIDKNKCTNVNVWESNIYDSITNNYDVIITNPPIRAGKEVYLKIIEDAFNYLNKDGELWFVMRTNHGVKTVYKNLSLKYKTDILEKSCGFYIIRSKKS